MTRGAKYKQSVKRQRIARKSLLSIYHILYIFIPNLRNRVLDDATHQYINMFVFLTHYT